MTRVKVGERQTEKRICLNRSNFFVKPHISKTIRAKYTTYQANERNIACMYTQVQKTCY